MVVLGPKLPADYVITIRVEEVDLPLSVLTFEYMFALYFDEETMEDLISLSMEDCQKTMDAIRLTSSYERIIITRDMVVSVLPVYIEDWNEFCFAEEVQ
jgi:hypothetical protein